MNAISDSKRQPPAIDRVNVKTEKALCLMAAVFTLLASGFVIVDLAGSLAAQARAGEWWSFSRHVVFGLIITFLIYGGVVYLLTRWAYYTRLQQHKPRSNLELAAHFGGTAPALAILIPSYKEEDKVVFQTMMSAALQQYPRKRVVLLLDDPPVPKNTADRASLERARTLPARVNEALLPMARVTARARAEFYRRRAETDFTFEDELPRLLSVNEHVAVWFERYAASYSVSDHADRAFVNNVLKKNVELLRSRADELGEDLAAAPDPFTVLAQEYGRLVALFSADVSSFERKRYLNLSHEPNKAMNLNSFIGLMGKSFKRVSLADGVLLQEADAADADTVVPGAEFLITLDADSIIVPDYALRLIDAMSQPGNERLAVVQTPYSAFPGATKALERIAGATTDIQYLIHQGFTHFDGTYWVGANALIRRRALDDIAVVEEERGYAVTRYIQDRTVIEDTESSVDLIERGWRLQNYPERMAYSATPPDFGSLVIQRRRWANGGLIILPKLLRYLARGPLTLRKYAEAFVRVHYLCSIAAVNIGLVFALAVPLATDITTAWLPFTALGYFLLYGRDLRLMGYRFKDLFGVYALNLLLIPVNLAGVFKSLQQAWTKQKIPFGRTPKVGDRTATQPIFVLVLAALVFDWLVAAGYSAAQGYPSHSVFALVNASILIYAVGVFVGVREAWEDVSVGWGPLRSRLRRQSYRSLRRLNRQTVRVMGNTPIIRLAVRPRIGGQTETAAAPSREVA